MSWNPQKTATARQVIGIVLAVTVGMTALSAAPVSARPGVDDDPPIDVPDPNDPDAPPFPGRPNPTQVLAGDNPSDPQPHNALRVRWSVVGNTTQVTLERQRDGGNWGAAYSTANPSATFDMIDDGLLPDTRYCYRIRARNQNGEGLSQIRCQNTTAEDAQSIIRAQLRLTTSVASGAATDKGVSATLGVGNFTHLDRVIDDFERGDTEYYDLSLTGVADMSDIDYLKIYSGTEDDWCLADVQLLINNKVVFDEYYGHENCRWFGSHNRGISLVFSRESLRDDSRWSPPPLRDLISIEPGYPGRTESAVAILSLPHDELMGRLEGAVGDAIHDVGYWRGSNAASVTYHTDSRLRVDLHLGADVNNWDDPSIDIYFYLDVEAGVNADGTVEISFGTDYIYADVDFAWWADVLDWATLCPVVAGAVLNDDFIGCFKRIEEAIEDGIRGAANQLAAGTGFDGGSFCCSDAFAVVTPEGGVDFVFELGTDPTNNPPTGGGGTLTESGPVSTGTVSEPSGGTSEPDPPGQAGIDAGQVGRVVEPAFAESLFGWR